jgi:mitochondrial inner membrane protease subunit 2
LQDEPRFTINGRFYMALRSFWARTTSRAKANSTFARSFARYGVHFASWLPVAYWLNTYVVEVTPIEGASMAPYLNGDHDESLERDRCLNIKWRPQQDLKRGMIVTFRHVHPPSIIDQIFLLLTGALQKPARPGEDRSQARDWP